jgi:hypothetical protein
MTSTDNLYDKLLIDMTMKNGEIGYGRLASGDYVSDYDIRHHVIGGGFGWTNNDKACGWDTSNASINESASWHEAGDTFDEGTQVVGMEVDDLACRCGKFVRVSIRWQADVSTTIHTVMRRLAELGVLDLRSLQ